MAYWEKCLFLAHTAVQAQGLVGEHSRGDLGTQAPSISWMYLSPGSPLQEHLHLDADGETQRKKTGSGGWGNDHILTPVACSSDKEKGSSVYTSLVLGHINYPNLGDMILNDLGVL